MNKTLLLILTLISPYFIYSQSPDKQNDSIRSYKLGEIVKTAGEEPPKRISTTDIIPFRQIQKSDATSVAGVTALVPSARLETNSRGETLIYLRNSGERQTALFFDGALMNIPWDNRMDMSFIPTDIIGQLTVAKGSSSVLYGPNTMGGAVNINTFERGNDGQTNILKSMFIEGGGYLLSGTSHNRSGETNIIVHFNSLNEPGIIAPQSPDYQLFNRTDSEFLPNSSQQRNSGYIRAETMLGDIKAGIGLLGITGQKGVVPQDNRENRTRFWRYGEWNKMMAILNLDYQIDNDMGLRSTIWLDGFSQQIDKYSSILYSDREAVQEDNDMTTGARLVYDMNIADGTLSLSALGYMSEHIWDEDGLKSTFTQNTASLAAEYRGQISSLDYVVGANYDLNSNPETGPFEGEQNSVSDWGALFGLGYDLSPSSRLFTNISRKNRFPTLREQYSDVDRFVLNPDLSTEKGILSELGYEYRGGDHAIAITAFYSSYQDLIEVRPALGDSLGRDERANIDDAVIPGIELDANGAFDAIDTKYLFNLSFMDPTGTSGGVETPLETRPSIIGFLRLENNSFGDLYIMPELAFNAQQYSYNASELVELGFQYRANLRLAYKTLIDNSAWEFFARLDNITDQPFLFKIGFPAAGRTFRTGLTAIL